MRLYFEEDKIFIDEKFSGISLIKNNDSYDVKLYFGEETIELEKISKEKLINMRDEIDKVIS